MHRVGDAASCELYGASFHARKSIDSTASACEQECVGEVHQLLAHRGQVVQQLLVLRGEVLELLLAKYKRRQ